MSVFEYERKIEWLNKNRIIYRKDPENDIPTEVYDWGWYFEDGTHECYTLFASSAKINTYKSLRWHLHVIWFLNPQLDQEDFERVAKFIANVSNGFVTFRIPPHILDNMIYDVSLSDMEEYPRNKPRKVIFRDFCGLTTKEKLQVVGTLIGRQGVTRNDIYEAMVLLHDSHEKITIPKIAESLGCSDRTIYRNMNEELKKEKELLNRQL
jgi:hypothetical protein